MTATRSTAGALADELGRRTGLRIEEHHRSRVDRLLAERGLHRLSAVAGLDHETVDALTDAVTTSETYFFRHPAQLAFLRSSVLPRLTAERAPDHVLQLWSAGCASGEEPYSLAVVLDEAGLADRSEVLGTELTAAALHRAREATYTDWSLRTADAEARRELFSPTAGRRHRLSPDVTARVRFERHNLLDATYPATPSGGFDVIMCRNVLLHLAPAAVLEISRRLVRSLAPGGWLITAPADPSVLDAVGTLELEAVVLPTGGVVHRRPDGPPATDASARRTSTGSARGNRARSIARRAAARRGDDDADPSRPGCTSTREATARCRDARAALEDGRPEDALTAAMSASFLDPRLAAAHLTLGLAAARTARPAVAARAFRQAVVLLEALPPDATVELCDDEAAGVLAELARGHLHLVGGSS